MNLARISNAFSISVTLLVDRSILEGQPVQSTKMIGKAFNLTRAHNASKLFTEPKSRARIYVLLGQFNMDECAEHVLQCISIAYRSQN